MLERETADRLIAQGSRAENEGRLSEACALYGDAVKAAPGYAKAHVNLGVGLEAAGDADGAVRSYEAALAVDAGDAYANYNLANLLYRRSEFERAGQLLLVALERKPDFPEARVALANVLDSRGETAAAAASLEIAVQLRPDYAGAWLNYAAALDKLARPIEAQAALAQATVLSAPDSLDARYSLASALRHLGRHDEATAAFEAAMQLVPDSAAGYYRLANAFRDADRGEEALDCLRRAVSLAPDYADARWALAMYQLPAVYPTEDDPHRARAAFSLELDRLDRWYDASRIAGGFEAVGTVQPFLLAYQEENNRDLLQRYGGLCTRLMGAWAERQRLPAAPRGHGSAGVCRVGVVSSFFSNHSVWSAIVRGWFGQLQRERIALHAFYLRPHEDEETRFARSRAAHFESGAGNLRQWVDAILRQRLDVLIYPEIGMDAMTLKLASLQLAPTQVAVWGHPETTGLPTIDYYLSAEDFEPADAQSHYSERLVALPHFGCYYSAKALTPAAPDLAKWGIDSACRLFICPGAPFKYAPRHDALLVEIARRTKRCRFVFFTFNVNPDLSRKLRQRLDLAFARGGLKLDDFVTFIPWQSGAAFYGLLERAAVFLDTIGFSGFNTAMHAVECGLPIVTREGRFMRGRLASGILKRMGLAELVAASDEDYISLAVRLMTDADYRAGVRERIAASRGVLFEDMAPIRAMEDFLVQAARR